MNVGKTVQNLYKSTYIDNSVSIQEPHDPWFGVASDPAAEPCNLAFCHCLGLRLGDKAWLESLILNLNQFRGTLPTTLHLPDALDGIHTC